MPSMIPMSSRCSMSFSTATGSTRSSTNWRTVSWMARWSALRSRLIPESAIVLTDGSPWVPPGG